MPELKHTQAKRLHASVAAHAGEAAADALLASLPLSASPSEKQKAAWARAACEALESEMDDGAAAIRKGCRCKPSPANVKALRALWEACGDMKAFAEQATKQADGAFTSSTKTARWRSAIRAATARSSSTPKRRRPRSGALARWATPRTCSRRCFRAQ